MCSPGALPTDCAYRWCATLLKHWHLRNYISADSERSDEKLRNRRTRLIYSTATAITLILGGCMRLPIPDEAAKGPEIDTVVRRVKCDLYDAFAERINAPYGQEWLHNWTAQASLNLIVNDQSLLSPGATFTQPLTAVTVPQVVTNFTRAWNLGLGAQAGNTATRNETITFSVSLEDLVRDGGQNCSFPNSIDLKSELGLKDWVVQSFSPADQHHLSVGYHKAPKTTTGGPSTAKVNETITNAMKSFNINKPNPTLDCVRLLWDNSRPPDQMTIQRDLNTIACDFGVVLDRRQIDLKNMTGKEVQFVAKTVEDLQVTIRDLIYWGPMQPEYRKWKNVTRALESVAIELVVFVDPPIDTIAHQAQFIIVWNASVSPGWTLLHFKGPSPATGAMASITKTNTHTLNVVLGPSSSPDSQGALQALQTGTALGNALNAAPGMVSH